MVTGSGKISINLVENDRRGSNTFSDKINLDVNQVYFMINHTSGDMDSRTFGFGLITLHEKGHTKRWGIPGNLHDFRDIMFRGTVSPIDVTGNTIRTELNSDTNTNWGQRLSYSPFSIGDTGYLPLTQEAYDMLSRASLERRSIQYRAFGKPLTLPTAGITYLNSLPFSWPR